MKRFFLKMRLSEMLIAAVVALALMTGAPFPASADGGYIIPANTAVDGMLSAQGHQPTATGCTIASGSTDADGTCTATAAAGAIVFWKTTMVNPPFCILSDASATPIAVYTVTVLQITLTTLTSGHVYRYHCVQQAGL